MEDAKSAPNAYLRDMDFRRVFIFVVLAFTFVGCQKRDDAVGKGSWTQEVWMRGDKIYNGILRQPFLQEMASDPDDLIVRLKADSSSY